MTNIPDGNYRDALHHLITAFNLAAPTSREQMALTAYIRAMQMDGESHETVLKYTVGAFFDGLAYGNWPQEKKS